MIGGSLLIAWILFSLQGLSETVDSIRLLIILGMNVPTFIAIIITIQLKGKAFLPPLNSHLMIFGLMSILVLLSKNIILDIPNQVGSVIMALIIADLLSYMFSVTVPNRKSCYLLRSMYDIPPSLLRVGLSLIALPVIYGMVGLSITLFNLDASVLFRYSHLTTFDAIFNSVLVLLSAVFLWGGIGSEIGLRGFVLPRILKHVSPVLSSLMIGIIQLVWLTPLYLVGVFDALNINGAEFFVWIILINIILTWVFLRTRASILATTGVLSMMIGLHYLLIVDQGFMLLIFSVAALFAILSLLLDGIMLDKTKALEHLNHKTDIDY